MADALEPMLAGLKVLDLTRALAGPACTRMLVEMGAEVIKVEPGPGGELSRYISKFKNDRSLYYVQQNRGKKSVCLNLRDPRALALVKEIAAQVDVVVENFKPGVIGEMGLGIEDLRKLKPDSILCSISALGQTGPLSSKPGYDYIAQAYSGVTSMIGEPGEPPYIPAVGLGDVSTGVHASLAILAALRHRDKTGRGQHLDIGLLDVYYHYHEANVHTYSASGGQVQPTRPGRHIDYVSPAGVFRGTGGEVMIMGFFHHWKDLCAAMDRKDLVEAEGWATDGDRLKNKPAVVELIETWLRTFSDVKTAIEKLEEHGVPCAPILSVAETVNHPHHRQRGTVVTHNDKLHGEFDMPGFPLRFSDFPEPLELEAALLGEHNAEVVTEMLGHSQEELETLRKDGVLIEKEC
jgi:crotonobetainyl-CoA:carnitine CoA-transferase CaiB-like acyl-CoA transferase